MQFDAEKWRTCPLWRARYTKAEPKKAKALRQQASAAALERQRNAPPPYSESDADTIGRLIGEWRGTLFSEEAAQQLAEYLVRNGVTAR